MSAADIYLLQILQKYEARDLALYNSQITALKSEIVRWASGCYLDIHTSGSRAKGTATSLSSDVDYLVSLKNGCKSPLKDIYNSLYQRLDKNYNIRKQNVSVRVNLGGLEVDITPARKLLGNTNKHNIYVSKLGTYKQTNIQQHINDVSQSGRLKEIKIIKIWRDLHGLDVPSTYLEYLLINKVLLGKPKGDEYLATNVWHVLKQFAQQGLLINPFSMKIVDPANSTNILSDLLTGVEKKAIREQAKVSISMPYWSQIVW